MVLYTAKAWGNWNSNNTWQPAGTPTANDDVIIPGNNQVTIPASCTATIGKGHTLTIEPGAAGGIVIDEGGSLVNKGSITTAREIANQGSFENYGTVTGDTTATIQNNGGTLNNLSGGTISTSYHIDNYSESVIINYGTIINNQSLWNSGLIINYGSINMNGNGSLSNFNSYDRTPNAAGFLENYGTLNFNAGGYFGYTGAESYTGNEVEGTFEGQLDTHAPAVFIMESGSVITLGPGVTLTIQGNTSNPAGGPAFYLPAGVALGIGLGATLSITEYGEVAIAGNVSNFGVIETIGGNSLVTGLVVNSGGVLNNNSPPRLAQGYPPSKIGTINNEGKMANMGTVNNGAGALSQGNMFVRTPAVLNNPGAIFNYGTFLNEYGVLNNQQGGSFSNEQGAVLNNEHDAVLNNDQGAILGNQGTFVSTGALNNSGSLLGTPPQP